MAGHHCKENQSQHPSGVRALYVHVPFCRRKCRYCSFYSRSIEGDLVDAYVRAAVAELDARRSLLAAPLASVFIGGGTPSVLPLGALNALLEPITAMIDEQTEFTVESNPESVSIPLACALTAAGVNRVTVGVQSFQAELLTFLARPHGPDDAIRAVGTLQDAGVTNIGIDLIYGIPGQSPASWCETLATALSLGVQHLSCYALSIDPGTALYSAQERGHVTAMDDGLQRALYEQAIAQTLQAGMQHYEISNFAMPGRECRHNITYWRNLPYVGIGPAAASYVAGVRSTAPADVSAYLLREPGLPVRPATTERLTGRAEMAETIMLALRMTQGLDRGAFAARFGCAPAEAFARTIERYVGLGALVMTPTHIRLAEWAYFVSDTILADVVAEA